ncbi:hypothetical protein EDD22DRAFT_971046 [Suillus occidentalis]|nr:hypothetical protein EDD22DRAFT_971046 [Suillus occidentalis]
MQLFIPSVLSALEALFKGPIWLVRRVISIFFSKRESPSLPTSQSVAPSSLSDSPYGGTTRSQYQRSHERTQWQQSSTHHQYPPPRPTAEHSESAYSQHQRSHEHTQRQPSSTYHPPPRPTAEHSESAYSQHQRSYERTQSQRPGSTDLPYSQPRPATTRYPPSPSQYTPPQPPSHRQPSVRLPAQPTPPVSPDVSPEVEPLQSRIPQRSRRVSGPESPTRAPEVVVPPVVIDPHEDPQSLRLKARNSRVRMEECFKKRHKALDRNEGERAQQFLSEGEAHKVNMTCLDKAASTKIYQGMRLMDGACRSRQLTFSLIQRIMKFVVALMKHATVRRFSQRFAGSNTIDLHRLYVSEAKMYFDEAVQKFRDSGESLLFVIVGRGNHSENNDAKIKPAIQEYGISLGLGVEVDPHNDGRLVVSLDDD